MRALACALVVLLAGAAAVTARAADFAPTLPEAVADVSGWEQVSGDFDTPGFRGDFRFYVNPRRQGLYQVMRFRTSTHGVAGDPLGAERVAFVRRPGVREPMLCWQREPAGVVPEWRVVEPETAEYRQEMETLVRVIGMHRSALLERR
jgi:hypothetical protein